MELERIYWLVSVILLSIDALWLIRLAFAFFARNSPLKKPIFVPFRLLFFGDFLFVFALYLPYHLYNTIEGFENENFQLDTQMCLIMGYIATVSVFIGLVGVTFVWFSTYITLQNMIYMALEGKRKAVSRVPLQTILILTSILCGTLWYIVARMTDTIGVFSGLYCSINDFRNFNGILICVACGISVTIMVIYAYKSYQLLAIQYQFGSSMDIRKKSLRNLKSLAIHMTITYLICWAPISLYIFMMLLGFPQNIWLSIFSGWMLKLRPMMDCIVVLYSSIYRDALKGTISVSKSSYSLNFIRIAGNRNRSAPVEDDVKLCSKDSFDLESVVHVEYDDEH